MRKVKAVQLIKYNGQYYGHGTANGPLIEMEDKEAERLLQAGAVAIPGSAEDHIAEFERQKRGEAMAAKEVRGEEAAKEEESAKKAIKAAEERAAAAEKKAQAAEARAASLEQRMSKMEKALESEKGSGPQKKDK